MLRFCALFLVLLFAYNAQAQEKKSIKLTGIVLKMDSIVPIYGANIFHKKTHLGVRSDQYGMFSIDVFPQDTLVFSAIGQQTTYYIVPDTLKDDHYSILQHLPPNNITLETVEITSWPSLEQFNQAFTKEHGLGEEIGLAKHNANPQISNIDALDASGNHRIEGMRYQNRYSYVYENAHIPMNNLLNPKRWHKLLDDIKKGSY